MHAKASLMRRIVVVTGLLGLVLSAIVVLGLSAGATGANGFEEGHTTGKVFIDPLNEHDGIIDHYPGQGHHTEYTHQRQIISQ